MAIAVQGSYPIMKASRSPHQHMQIRGFLIESILHFVGIIYFIYSQPQPKHNSYHFYYKNHVLNYALLWKLCVIFTPSPHRWLHIDRCISTKYCLKGLAFSFIVCTHVWVTKGKSLQNHQQILYIYICESWAQMLIHWLSHNGPHIVIINIIQVDAFNK